MWDKIKTISIYILICSTVYASEVTNQVSASYYKYGGNYNYAYYDVSWFYSIIGDINKGSINLPDTEFSIYLSNSKSIYEWYLYTNDANLVLKTDLNANQKFSPFLIFQWTFDSTTALDYRINPGMGGKVRLGKGLSISYAGLWEIEKYTGYKENSFFRHSFRPKQKLSPMEGVKIEEQFFYKPTYKFDSYLIENIFSIYVDTVIPGVSLSIQYNYNLNSNPPPGYKKEDSYISFGFSLQL